ncbi:MAG: phosphate ABC transporter permease PstA [Pseudomonadota bacterium]
MTEPALSPDAFAEHRLRKRHASERRFKLYGQLAIGIAIGFLAILLFSVSSKAIGAFSRHMLVLTIEPIELSERSDLIVSDLNLAVRNTLLNEFPEIASERPARIELFGLTTRLAVLPLTEDAAQTPNVFETPVETRLALSDDLDLYLKNEIKQHQSIEVGRAGRLALETAGTFRLTDAGPDGFIGFQDYVAALPEPRTDILISLSGAWFELLDVSGAALELEHMAGPLPSLGEQSGSRIDASILPIASENRKVTNRQIVFGMMLQERGKIQKRFNQSLFSNSDSTYPELAGAAAALMGSLFTMLITALFALPVGILAAVYLEEFAKKSLLTNIIEVNINNLAAVPSIIFGLLGAAVFLNTFGLPRSVPLVGGLVLGLLALPTIIIASRAALQSVPPSVRDAALGLGASHSQAVFHHVLPLAAPGILTGAIIAMARALGETAPLLLIGMVAFISEVPRSPNDEATVLPVLIYKWFSGAERAWEPMTAAVIILLLTILVGMNLVAILLRRRFERRW